MMVSSPKTRTLLEWRDYPRIKLYLLALDGLSAGILKRRVSWILDAGIRGFFEHMDHGWTMRFVAHRVADNRAWSVSGCGPIAQL